MSQITTIDRTALRNINADVTAALAAVQEKYGISIEIKNAHFSDGPTGDAKLTYSIVSADGNTMTAEAEAFKDGIQYWGAVGAVQQLTADHLFQTFTSQGKEFKVTGLRTRARKQPILAEEVASGKTYIFTYEGVARAFAVANLTNA